MTDPELMSKIPYSVEAAEYLLKQSPPDFREEDWKYTHFAGFGRYKIHSANPATIELPHHPLPDAMADADHVWQVVLVNGVWQPHLSNLPDPSSGIRVSGLGEAISRDPQKLQPTAGALALKKGHYYSHWAMAQAAGGILIEVSREVLAPKHLLIRTINDIQPQEQVLPIHYVVVMEPHSSLTLSELQEGSGAGMTLALHEIHLGKGANLRHSQIQLWGNKHECIQQVLVSQQQDSHYAHFAYCGGGGKVRNQLTVMQDGQLSHTELTGLVLPGAGEHIDNQTYMCHRSPNCSSRQRYRSLVGREGTSVFNGKVLVDPEAQKTDAYQHHASLLMHDTAVSNAKPELEIYADDVKCSHGATTGMLDAGEIHYMRTRGLSEERARMMLQEAFLRELLDSLPDESLRNYCLSHFTGRLQELNQPV